MTDNFFLTGNFAPVADVKTHLSQFLDECRRSPVIVTRNGRPTAMLVGVDDADDLERLVLIHTPRFRALFAHLLEDRAPLVIHCTAGKDRTGFACALILHTLGVSGDVIAEDYLLTNQYYRRDPNNGSELPEDVKNVLGTVRASFLDAAFEAIDTDYGDLETYLRDGLGLGRPERASLEARYLQS